LTCGVQGFAAVGEVMRERALLAVATLAIDLAKREIAAKSQAACVKATRVRVLAAEISGPTAEADLIGFGLDQDQAELLVRGWTCERAAKEKRPSVGQLCEWRQQGQIDDLAYVSSLQNLGYDLDEAQRIATSCGIKLNQRLFREQKQREAELLRAAKAAEAAQKAKLTRDAKLLKAANAYAVAAGLEIEQASAELDAARSIVRQEFELSLNQSVEVVVIAAVNWFPGLGKSLLDLTREYTRGFVEVQETV